jgi:hypothetical protein
LGLEHCFEILI